MAENPNLRGVFKGLGEEIKKVEITDEGCKVYTQNDMAREIIAVMTRDQMATGKGHDGEAYFVTLAPKNKNIFAGVSEEGRIANTLNALAEVAITNAETILGKTIIKPALDKKVREYVAVIAARTPASNGM